MSNTNMFKRVAVERGFTVWYDPSLKAWTIAKLGHDTQYIPTYIMENVPLYKLMEIYLPRNEND